MGWQMQSNIEWEKYANQLAGDLAAKGIELEKVSLYLACQTHQCKHADLAGCIRAFVQLLKTQPPILTIPFPLVKGISE